MKELHLLIILININILFASLKDAKIEDEHLIFSNWSVQAGGVLQNGVFPEFRGERHGRSARNGHGDVDQQPDQKAIKRQFEAYYKCIRKKNRLYHIMKTFGEIVLIQEGQRLELTCDLCYRPDQDKGDYVIRWSRALATTGREGFIIDDGEKFIISDDVLAVHDVTLDDAGQYYCTKDGGFEVAYVVDVVLVETHREVVEPGMSGPQAARDTSLKERNIQLTTKWSSWSQCDKCGRGGRRRRLGTCTVLKVNKSKPVKPLPLPVLDKFVTGVPCRSSLLPASVEDHKDVAGRESELMIGRCFTPCPIYTVQNVTDRTGKVINSVNVQERYFDASATKPTLLPRVKRKSLYETVGVDIVLTCPHKSKANILIRWQNGTHLINPTLIKTTSNGRIKIDVHGQLHIKNLHWGDARTLSCWLQGRLVATIKLVIVGKKSHNLKDYVVYAGCGLVGLTILIIGIGVCMDRNKKTAR